MEYMIYAKFLQKVFLLTNSKNSQGNTSARVSFLINLQAQTCNFTKSETLAQVLYSLDKFVPRPP